jgi:two-component system, LytTR family, response regulator
MLYFCVIIIRYYFMPIRALIVDDEQEACDNLANILNEYIDERLDILGCANSTKDAEKMIKKLNPDVVFLDIEMANENAFQFLERLEEINFDIIFVTAYDEYAIRAFKLNAVDYILKPINIDELNKATKKLRERITYRDIVNKHTQQYQELAEQIASRTQQQQIILKDNNQYDTVPFKDIRYVKAMGSYSNIYFKKGNIYKSLLMSRAIAEYEELLPSDFFFRTHRSFLVNCRFIDTISKEAMVVNLDNQESLPVGRRRLSELLQFLKQFKVADV